MATVAPDPAAPDPSGPAVAPVAVPALGRGGFPIDQNERVMVTPSPSPSPSPDPAAADVATLRGALGITKPPAAFQWKGQRIGLLFNGGSGSSTAQPIAVRLSVLLSDLGAAVPGVQDHPQHIGEQLEQLATETPTVIVAIGGDGTINAGASLAIERDIPLLVVPAGTMDLVARDLGIPIEFKDLLPRMSRLADLRIDFATVNDRIFLHSSLMGLVPTLATIRESMRATMRESGTVLGWMPEAGDFVSAAMDAEDHTVIFRSDKGTAERQTKSVAVSCNPLVDAEPGSHRRGSLVSGTLGVYASNHQGPFAPIKLLASLATGQLRKDHDTHFGVCTTLDIEPDTDTVTVSNDGELVTLDAPLRYRIHPLGLRVLVPIPDAEDDSDDAATDHTAKDPA